MRRCSTGTAPYRLNSPWSSGSNPARLQRSIPIGKQANYCAPARKRESEGLTRRILSSSPLPSLQSGLRGLDRREMLPPLKTHDTLAKRRRIRVAASMGGPTSQIRWKAFVIHPVKTTRSSKAEAQFCVVGSMVVPGEWEMVEARCLDSCYRGTQKKGKTGGDNGVPTLASPYRSGHVTTPKAAIHLS
jgi:hypothetical protein